MNDIWLIVGKEVDGNNVKNYILMNYNGNTQFVQKRSILKFCRQHTVLNVQVSGNNITGKGISLNSIPRYSRDKGFGLQQIGGISQQEVIQYAQPLINQYKQNEQKKNSDTTQNQINKQLDYVINKINIIHNIINIALAMKDITNEMASNGNFTRYLKQIDIDNAEGDSLTNLIQRQGVNGLANGLIDRINRLRARVDKYKLDKELHDKLNYLLEKCETIKKLHKDTKDIIKSNKEEVNNQDKQDLIIDDIETVNDEELIDAIEIPAETEIVIEENLTIQDVIDTIMFNHDGYKTEKPSGKEYTEVYRSWDTYGFKIIDFITIIYKYKDNKFRVVIGIPPMFDKKSTKYKKAQYPGDYPIKITRENIDRAYNIVQSYINNALIDFADRDKLIYNVYSTCKSLDKEVSNILGRENMRSAIINNIKNMEISPIEYLNSEYNNLYTRVKTTKNLIDTNEICLFGSIIPFSGKYGTYETTINFINKANKELQSYIDKKRKMKEEQEHEYNNMSEEFLKHSLSDAFENINDEIYRLQEEWQDDEHADPFTERTCRTLKLIQSKIDTNLDIGNTCEYSILPYSVNYEYGEEYFSNLQNIAMESFEELIEQLVKIFNDEQLYNLSSRYTEKLRDLYSDIMDIWQYKIDNTDDFNDPIGEFREHYIEFIGGHYTEGNYGGLRGKVYYLAETIEDLINQLEQKE